MSQRELCARETLIRNKDWSNYCKPGDGQCPINRNCEGKTFCNKDGNEKKSILKDI